MSEAPDALLPIPSPYERDALREIALWKEPAEGWFGAAFRKANDALRSASELVYQVPGVTYTVDHLLSGLFDLTNEIAQDSVGQDAVWARYQALGHAVHTHRDVHLLDLATVDDSLEGLATKYRLLAGTEGAATGYVGLPGLAPDIFALAALSLRAAGEIATHCGFDLADPSERLFALQVLNAASEPAESEREAALEQVEVATQALARRTTVETVERVAKGRAFRAALQALVMRIARVKLGQVLPVTGAVLGGTYNAYFMSKACDAARFTYRERFLIRKYGPDVQRYAS
ncbi:MAG: EcsC family protein [Bacteroidota bacterium]